MAGTIVAIPGANASQPVNSKCYGPGIQGDFRLVGPIDTVNNAAFYFDSRDGTCTGTPTFYQTLVRANSTARADAKCMEIAGVLSNGRLYQSIYRVPHSWWRCR